MESCVTTAYQMLQVHFTPQRQYGAEVKQALSHANLLLI